MKYEPKPGSEWERFDKVMDGLMAVPYSELQKELEKDRKRKAAKKKRSNSKRVQESARRINND